MTEIYGNSKLCEKHMIAGDCPYCKVATLAAEVRRLQEELAEAKEIYFRASDDTTRLMDLLEAAEAELTTPRDKEDV